MPLTSRFRSFFFLSIFISFQVLSDPALQKLQDLETAAIEGDVLAQTELAARYYLGEGVEQNLSQAVAWYQLAAKNGDKNAQYSLANLYLLGEGIAADPATASHWYQMAANQGHVEAQQRLGQLSSQQKDEAVEVVQTAEDTETSVAESETPDTNSDLFEQLFGSQTPSQVIAEPQQDISQNTETDKKETKPVEIAEVRPNSDLQPGPIINQETEPEVVYEKITEDNPELFRLYQRAREGDPKAQYSIGNAFYKGEGVIQNHEQAFLWFRRAADSGNANAQYSLGNIYFMGEGVPQSDDRAYYWYEKASLSGHKKATHNLYNLKKLTGRTQPPALTLDNELESTRQPSESLETE